MATSQVGAMLFPPELSFAVSKVDSVNHNSFQISPASGATAAGSGQNIRFSFPTTNLMDFKNSSIQFRVKTTGAGARLPCNASYLFSRLQVLAGGQTMCVVNDFGLTEYIKYVCEDREPAEHKHDQVLTSMLANGAKGSGANGATLVAEDYDGSPNVRFTMNLGALAHASPSIVPLDMLPSIEFILTVAGADVMSTIAGVSLAGAGNTTQYSIANAAASTFEILDATLVASMYSIGNENYKAALGRRLAENGSLELILPKQMTTFSSSWTGSSRFSYSSHSLDRLHTVWRSTATSNTYNAQKQPALVAGSAVAALNLGCAQSLSQYGAGGLAGAGKVEYTSAHQQLQFPTNKAATNKGPILGTNGGAATKFDFSAMDAASLNYRVNSALVPQFDCGPYQWAHLSAEANEVCKTKYSTLASWLHNYFVMSYRMSLPNSGVKPCISGMNTLGAGNAFIEVVSGGGISTSDYDTTTIAESTTAVQIQLGRQIVVVS
jgi:hypothetical protein